MKENVLRQTAKEYFLSGQEEFVKSRFNSSVVLYFKSLVALVDLFLLLKTKHTPSSHSERFRITQKEFPQIYDILDRDFPFYQDSYSQVMGKELAEVIRDDALTLSKKTQVKL